jgi:DNA-binding protein H-NS
MELNELSLHELKTLQKDINRAIVSYETRRITAARAELEARAKDLGVTLSQVMGEGGAKERKAPLPVKYRNPHNPEETWSGRGRKPRWLTVALTSVGAKMEDFVA